MNQAMFDGPHQKSKIITDAREDGESDLIQLIVEV